MRLLPLLLASLLTAAAGCGSATDPGAATDPTDRLPVGRSFDATGATEGGRDRPLPAKAGIEFRPDGTASVATGCNGASGQAELRNGRLVGEGFAITEMACMNPGVMEQETFVMSVLEGQPEVLLDGNVLVLRTAAAEIRFLDRSVADPDRPLEGTRWRVTGDFSSQVASSRAALTGELVLSAGRLRFTGTCQEAEGPAVVAGTRIEVGPLDLKRLSPVVAATSSTAVGPHHAPSARTCSADEEKAEAEVRRLLAGSLEAKVSSANLMLTRPDGSGLTLTQAT